MVGAYRYDVMGDRIDRFIVIEQFILKLQHYIPRRTLGLNNPERFARTSVFNFGFCVKLLVKKKVLQRQGGYLDYLRERLNEVLALNLILACCSSIV